MHEGGIQQRVNPSAERRTRGAAPATASAVAARQPASMCTSTATLHPACLSGSASHSATSSGESMMYFCGGSSPGSSQGLSVQSRTTHALGSSQPSNPTSAPTQPMRQTPIGRPTQPPHLNDGLHQLRALRGRQNCIQRIGGRQQRGAVPTNGLPAHIRQVARLCLRMGYSTGGSGRG